MHSNCVHKLRRFIDLRHTNEGGIHLWPDDHIEWGKIIATMAWAGLAPVMDNKYLLFRGGCYEPVYRDYVGRVSDMRCLVLRKIPAASTRIQ